MAVRLSLGHVLELRVTHLLLFASGGAPWRWLGFLDSVASLLFLLLDNLFRVFELWVDARMEKAKLAHLLHLNERIQLALLQLNHAEGLAEIVPVLVEVDDTPVHVNKHAYN